MVKYKWPSFGNHLTQMLHNMMKSSDLTDVTLITDDRIKFNAHKVVLSATSPVLKEIIHDSGLGNMVIFLKSVGSKELKNILEFIYDGQTTMREEDVENFISIAESLEIEEISKTNDLSRIASNESDDEYEEN